MRLIGVILAALFLVAGLSAEAGADMIGGIQKSWSSVSDTFTKSTKAGFQGMRALSTASRTVTQAACVELSAPNLLGPLLRLTPEQRDGIRKAGVRARDYVSGAYSAVIQTAGGAYSAGVQFAERARGEVSGVVERYPFLKESLRYKPLLPWNDPADQLRRFQKGRI